MKKIFRLGWLAPALGFFLGLLPAAAEAVAPVADIKCTSKVCTCLESCPTIPCGGNEGDIIYFNGCGSTGVPNLSYDWVYGDGTTTHGSGVAPSHRYAIPNTHALSGHPNGYPAGFPVSLIVTDGASVASPPATLNLPVANVAPYVKAWGLDLNGQTKYFGAGDTLFAYVNSSLVFNAKDSGDAGGPTCFCLAGPACCLNSDPPDCPDPRAQLECAITAQWDWNWDGTTLPFKDPPDATGSNPTTPVWDTTGTYRVRVQIKDDDAPDTKASTASLTVTVLPEGPYAQIDGPFPSPFNEGQSVNFKDKSLIPPGATAKSWEWNYHYDGNPAHFVVQDSGASVWHTFLDTCPSKDPITSVCLQAFWRVGLRVTDTLDRVSNIATIEVTPRNVPPTANLKVRDTDGVPGTLLNPPYSVAEGKPLRFDGTGSSASPGYIIRYQWDWDYHPPTFRPDLNPLTQVPVPDHAFAGVGAYIVRLGATDDDNSTAFADVPVQVTDILPAAQVECTTCLQIGSDWTLLEGEEGTFRVSNTSAYPDEPLTLVEWDCSYDPLQGFVAEASGPALTQSSCLWDLAGAAAAAARITDDDGHQALATLALVIRDRPPTCKITPAGPVDETRLGGASTLFSAKSSKPGGPKATLGHFYWDDNYNGVTFNSNPDLSDPTSSCAALACDPEVTGKCCSLAPWLACLTAADCPVGRGVVPLVFTDDRLSPRRLALKVEDKGLNNGVTCFNSIVIHNVPPVFDSHVTPAPTVNERDTWEFQPKVSDSVGDLTHMSYSCPRKPEKMECDAQNGHLFWKPGQSDVDCDANPREEHHVQLAADDNDGGTAMLDFYVKVLNVVDPPVITGFEGGASPTLVVGQPYSAKLIADSPDQVCSYVNLYYYFCTGTSLSGMTIDQNGTFRWKPAKGQEGKHGVSLCARLETGTEDCAVCIPVTFDVTREDQAAVTGFDAETVAADPGRACVTGKVVANPPLNPGDPPPALTYLWRQVSGPVAEGGGEAQVFLNPADSSAYPDPPRVCFLVSLSGAFRFGMKADNGSLPGPEALITVQVNSVKPGAVPVGDRNFPVGAVAELNASRSGDYNVNDAHLTVSWKDEKNVLDRKDIARPTFLILDPQKFGAFSFEATAADPGGLSSDARTVQVEILDLAGKKALPFATFKPKFCKDSGHCQEVRTAVSGSKIVLDAAGSANRVDDADPTLIWSLIKGPVERVNLSPAGTNQVEVLLPKPGAYTFGLLVKNGDFGKVQSRLYSRTVYVGDPANQVPAASAGADMGVTLAAVPNTNPRLNAAKVELDGSGLDPEGAVLDFHWSQTGGVYAPLTGADTARPGFYAFAPGLYTFQVVARDGENESPPASVNVAVAGPGNHIPVAAAAIQPPLRQDPATGDITADRGVAVALDAGVSADPDQDPLAYEWTQVEGPAVVLMAADATGLTSTGAPGWDARQVIFTPDVFGAAYAFRLVVWDGQGAPSKPLLQRVNVLDISNIRPVCQAAAESLAAAVGQRVTLDAGASFDPDVGQTFTYEWKQVNAEGSPALLPILHADQKAAEVQPLKPGLYQFRFTMFDGYETCSPAPTVTLTVGPNGKPSAVTATSIEAFIGETVTLDGSASSDPDRQPLTFTWTIEPVGNTLGLLLIDLKPDSHAVKPTFLARDTGRAILSLVVDDGFENGLSEPAEVVVTIKPRAEACLDDDQDGFFQNCEPVDCDDNDPDKNDGIPGSCEGNPIGPGDADKGENPGSGEGGGCNCSTSEPGFSAWLAAGLLAGLAVRRRRRA